MTSETTVCAQQEKAKNHLIIAGGMLALFGVAASCTDITLGWLAASSFVAGAINIAPDLSWDSSDTRSCTGMSCVDSCKIQKLSPHLQFLDITRCVISALAMTLVPLGLFIVDSVYDHDGVEKTKNSQARMLAVYDVLEGKNVGFGTRQFYNRKALRNWGDEIEVRHSAKIIEREEPLAVGKIGRATVEILDKDAPFLGAVANRMEFQLVREPDGGVSYYFMEPVQDDLSFGNGTLTHQAYKPRYFCKRGAGLPFDK